MVRWRSIIIISQLNCVDESYLLMTTDLIRWRALKKWEMMIVKNKKEEMMIVKNKQILGVGTASCQEGILSIWCVLSVCSPIDGIKYIDEKIAFSTNTLSKYIKRLQGIL